MGSRNDPLDADTGVMTGTPRVRLVTLTAVVIAVLTASAAFGAVGGRVSRSTEPVPSPSCTSPTPSASPSVDPSASPSVDPSASPSVDPSASPSVDPSASPSPEADPSESPSPEAGEDCAEPSDSPTATDTQTVAAATATDTSSPDAARADACYAAAGMSGPSTDTSGTKQTGLDNAIQHVLANCLKNPQAPGLLTALQHLVENQARHEAQQAAHDAKKAAQQADHPSHDTTTHGNSGTHGNGGGNGGTHGNSGSHGPANGS
jgi:hypothetical protein